MTNEAIARRVRKAQAGCHESFGQLIAYHEKKIRDIIGRSLRNYRKEDKEDMYQEVLLHTWRNIKSKKEAAHFTAWLIVLTKWRCAAMKRKRQQPRGYDFRQEGFEKLYDWQRISLVFFIHEENFMDIIFSRETARNIQYAISKLDEMDRDMLQSIFWSMEILKEQSKRLEICVVTCRRRRRKAMENFKQALLGMVAPEGLYVPS
ncbi:hypothetical protein LCGC14_1409940 [marine sediment metagenome]|uniref:RNA polymerase sigma-70 region 2 domain-containing protein n=1 Tax=marine sediment metagenome TaxID=412755 RepID=A0A0F9JUW6_9ZZZZ